MVKLFGLQKLLLIARIILLGYELKKTNLTLRKPTLNEIQITQKFLSFFLGGTPGCQKKNNQDLRLGLKIKGINASTLLFLRFPNFTKLLNKVDG